MKQGGRTPAVTELVTLFVAGLTAAACHDGSYSREDEDADALLAQDCLPDAEPEDIEQEEREARDDDHFLSNIPARGFADRALLPPPNVIIVGWDGTQRDHFRQCYLGELPECPDGLPHIEALSGGTIYSSTATSGATETKPGWAQILTGYNAKVTGVYTNGIYRPIPAGYTLFEKIENHLGERNVVTMFISGKGVHTGGACPGDPTYDYYGPTIEELGQPWCLAKEHVDYFETDMGENEAVGARALELLERHQDDPLFSFFLFKDPDATGHREGENSVQYSERIMDADRWLGSILAKLEDLGIDGRTLVYVTTDHGFDEDSRDHLNAPYGFLASNDPLIVRHADRRDLAPTILQRYGISLGAIGPAPPVDGSSLYTPKTECTQEGAVYIYTPESPGCCIGLSLIGLDRKYDECIPPTGGTGDASGYCMGCGNAVCDAPENACNCPQDCSP